MDVCNNKGSVCLASALVRVRVVLTQYSAVYVRSSRTRLFELLVISAASLDAMHRY